MFLVSSIYPNDKIGLRRSVSVEPQGQVVFLFGVVLSQVHDLVQNIPRVKMSMLQMSLSESVLEKLTRREKPDPVSTRTT